MEQIRFCTTSPYNSPVLWAKHLCLDGGKFQLIHDRRNPDYIIATEHIYTSNVARRIFRDAYSKSRVVIYYAGESIAPDLNLFDYAICFDKHLALTDRIARRPTLGIFGGLVKERLDIGFAGAADEMKNKRYFCNFIYGNARAHPHRDWLFTQLSRYKHVDSLGYHLHNRDTNVPRGDLPFDVHSVLMKKPYKFSIASENACYDGYMSEKIITSFLAHTVPIYWGNPSCFEEFNPEAFINANGLSA